ncbi:cation exchanger, putative [Acanthamoeba castellanii str. Neff]|uniref:Cation exchanger, putative n=1 Tax=Acanthamoeba castellanii (strain ATCC 30010 / Neff) TaxID=1257118 RepID=L8HAF4_ACACF|nr:cation exchanger, putative [Acanthamoeba castellanii str. Neff]ELR22217.1 cation exchanger, putative [Acanthamoeba castellanii str. Neff]
MADQSPEPTPPHREVVDFTQSAPAAIVTTVAADETRPRGSTSGSIPTVVVQDFDEGAALRRARSNSRKKKKKKQKAHKKSTTETETGSESDTEDEAEESSSSSSSSESDDEEEEQEEKKAPPKKTRFDVPKKAKKDKSALAPRSSVDVAALRRSEDWRGAPRASIDYFADIRNPPRYSVDLRRSEDRHRYSEIAGDAFMRRRSFGTRGTALTVEPLDEQEEDLFGRRSREMPALFGIRPSWSGRESVDRRRFTQQLDNELRAPHPVHQSNILALIGNIIYAALFGWIIAAAYMAAAGVLWLSQVGKPYAYMCKKLAGYYLWPFGKYLTVGSYGAYVDTRPAGYGAMSASKKDDTLEPFTESTSLLTSQSKRSPVMTEEAYVEVYDDFQAYEVGGAAKAIWSIVAAFLTVIHAAIAAICWIVVVSIPMSKVHQVGIKMAWHDPLAVRITSSAKMDGEIELSTEQAFSLSYVSYQALGVNVVLLNMTPCILIVVLFELVIPHEYHPPSVIFALMCLFGIVPLAYIIGTATNFTVGAMLNAIFGVSIEIILYSSAIRRGGLETLVQAGVTGSVLGDLLLIPGLSMLAGGIKYKEQRFSPAVAGVSSVLLVISVIGAFTPTIVWLVYGEYHFSCQSCTFFNGTEACQACDFVRVTDYDSSPVYIHAVRPLMYACSIILPFAYLVGLLFTLKTHSYIFENDAPRWTIRKSSIVLGISIALFAIVSEGLVAVMEPALHDLGINQTFAGLTLMALVPSSAEYVNAIQFALNNQIALSMEIGASSAVQICLIMMPILVGFSAFVNHLNSANSFILVFPLFSVFAIIMSVIIVNYISIEGVTNYFKGASLTIIYLLFVAAFFFSQHVTV